jgi:hypothetical protein
MSMTGKRTTGSTFLRGVMSKFNKRDNKRTANAWGDVYQGDADICLDRAENHVRQQICDSSAVACGKIVIFSA